MCGLLESILDGMNHFGIFDIPLLGDILGAIGEWFWSLLACGS